MRILSILLLSFFVATVAQAESYEKRSAKALCANLRDAFKEFRWQLDPCPKGLVWKIGGFSVQGRPLWFAEFGDDKVTNTTLIISSVHGDEITPVYLGFALVNWLREHPELLKGKKVVVAPFVNPDGFFAKPRTRMNAHGVDVNRNFKTKDWPNNALRLWKLRFRSDKRRFPGARPGEEPETIFQESLIRLFRPKKILSVHSPLGFTDYDGPENLKLSRFSAEYLRQCIILREKMKAVSGGFYPGSLGNFAGREQGIPTITLELPTANPQLAVPYWESFKPGVSVMIDAEISAKSTSP